MLIETRQQRYGDLATKREAFYSHAELATFKRAWYWHIQASEWPMDGLMRCGCPWCDKAEEGEPAVEVALPAVVRDGTRLEVQEYTTWTWEG